ncbi:MAG TPA: hypothetical protein IAC00_05930 [Candidatus Limivicinus faecipullorum]|nr:hypothetical protein [Candidatus Limivicinus faecipullorum]
MKKFMSLLLALLLVASLGSAAFAEADKDASFGKTYKLENADTTSPAETFTFKFSNGQVTDAAEGTVAPEIPDATVSFAGGEASADTGFTKDVSVALSSIHWPSVGIYTYDVKEVPGSTPGVTYSNDTLKMKVTVAYDDQTQTYYTAFVTMSLVDADGDGQTDVKTGAFENTYSAGSLAVTKTVTGNMGDRDKYFAITVTLTGEQGKTYASSYTVSGGSKLTDGTAAGTTTSISVDGKSHTFYLKHGETFTIENLPYGVTYTVAEADYTTEGYEEAEIIFPDQNKKIDTASETVGITNNKQATVDTGIVLDSLPYVLLLVLSIGGAVLFLLKRRSSRES